jgi:hypothetical protein|nr:MAG TPA: hypothetical protein [Caudoviricetes sp.]
MLFDISLGQYCFQLVMLLPLNNIVMRHNSYKMCLTNIRYDKYLIKIN